MLGCTLMINIDVDDIMEINHPDPNAAGDRNCVEVVFKDGTVKTFSGPELPEVLEILKHWTPPMA
jgi:hypothetical protein